MTNTRDERGSSAVEYGLLLAAIAAVLATTIFAVGGIVRDAFERVGNGIACNAVSADTLGYTTSVSESQGVGPCTDRSSPDEAPAGSTEAGASTTN